MKTFNKKFITSILTFILLSSTCYGEEERSPEYVLYDTKLKDMFYGAYEDIAVLDMVLKKELFKIEINNVIRSYMLDFTTQILVGETLENRGIRLLEKRTIKEREMINTFNTMRDDIHNLEVNIKYFLARKYEAKELILNKETNCAGFGCTNNWEFIPESSGNKVMSIFQEAVMAYKTAKK